MTDHQILTLSNDGCGRYGSTITSVSTSFEGARRDDCNVVPVYGNSAWVPEGSTCPFVDLSEMVANSYKMANLQGVTKPAGFYDFNPAGNYDSGL